MNNPFHINWYAIDDIQVSLIHWEMKTKSTIQWGVWIQWNGMVEWNVMVEW